MKKCLLFASAAVFTVSVFAQSQQVDKSKAALRGNNGEKIDQEPLNYAPIKQTAIPNEKAGSVIDIGTSFNVFSVLGDRQNQVVYNAAINTVGFVHRQNDGGAGGSGIISFDYSTDGGATWTINPFQLTPGLGGGNGNRYPNITMYNPAANTNSANAYVVVTGPQLQTGVSSAANGWGGTFRSSSLLSGTNLDEQYLSLSTDSQGDNNEWGAAGLFTAANGVVFDVTTNIDNAQTNLAADNYSAYFINKGVFNTTNNNFDWTNTSFTPNWHTTMDFNSGTQTNIATLANMAWSPNGMIGYMVAMGALNNASNNTMWRPYVLKTTDGGTTWNNVNDFDFSTDAVMQQYIFPLNTNPAVQRPFFSSFDMVVDINGELRIFGEVASGFSDHPDSLNFTFAARQAGFLMEVATNGAGWDVTFIDSVRVDDFEYDATNALSFFIRPQATRSQDGSKVFYTWSSTDPITTITDRSLPDVYAIGHDISAIVGLNDWTPITNLTSGVAGANFVAGYPTIAAETIENGTSKQWEIPLVYGTDAGGAAFTDGLAPPQWHYLRGVGFDSGDFIKASVKQNIRSNDVSMYPNPATDIVSINVDNVNEFDYTVIDIIGNVVTSNHVSGNKTQVDLSNNPTGVYFIQISNENSVISKKLVLTK